MSHPPGIIFILFFFTAASSLDGCSSGDGSSEDAGGADVSVSGDESDAGGDSHSDSDTDTDTDTDTDSDTDSDSDSVPDIDFHVSITMSQQIPTVAIVEWSADIDSIDSAYIDFGTDTGYGMKAPVDLDEPGYRTLLLGMKPSTKYHLRITAMYGDTEYRSADYTTETGQVPNGLVKVSTETLDEDALAGGFIVACIFKTGAAVILDADGEYVWWYETNINDVSRARMSWDGRDMLIQAVNVRGGKGRIIRVSMDGEEVDTIGLPEAHHDFAVLPEGTITYISFDGARCDNIFELNPAGDNKLVYSVADSVTIPPNTCHTNSIHYWQDKDAYTISVLNNNLFIKIDRASGSVDWIFGGAENEFAGDVSWEKQHGHHLLDDGLLFFSNGPPGGESKALEYSLDEESMEAQLVWSYSSGNSSNTHGDVQRLENGNILVTFSNQGEIHEVDPDGNLVRKTYWGMGGAVSYTMHRPSLYGPPPKR